MGSSPRLRGTPARMSRAFSGVGIIPALAGNTWARRPMIAGSRDHPRACGEHTSPRWSLIFSLGSSPRLRGTHCESHPEGHRSGIIPALAGNTALMGCWCSFWGDHPRACGEHYRLDNCAIYAKGSSPRLRGTLLFPWRVGTVPGIIPALAGNTQNGRRAPTRNWDHPRACGEHWSTVVVASTIWGSSPRLRGTPVEHPGRARHAGIIPALAGNTD